jgi:hypothetical protein
MILQCQACSIRNRVPDEPRPGLYRCGSCKTPLKIPESQDWASYHNIFYEIVRLLNHRMRETLNPNPWMSFRDLAQGCGCDEAWIAGITEWRSEFFIVSGNVVRIQREAIPIDPIPTKGRYTVNAKESEEKPIPPGYQIIYRDWYRGRSGEKMYAKDYGYEAWRFIVPIR